MATAWFRTSISFSAGVPRGALLTSKGLLLGAVIQAAVFEAIVEWWNEFVEDLTDAKYQFVNANGKTGLLRNLCLDVRRTLSERGVGGIGDSYVALLESTMRCKDCLQYKASGRIYICHVLLRLGLLHQPDYQPTCIFSPSHSYERYYFYPSI